MTNREPISPASFPERLAPVNEENRIESIDILRGVAVLGILVMNIYGFAMPFEAYNNPMVWGGTGTLSKSVWYVTHILFDSKFLSIFSMLFGAGLIIMTERSGAGKFAGIWYKRNLWLLALGAVHAYLIWFGDILVNYASLGFLLYPFRRIKAKNLIISGSLCLLFGMVMATFGGFWTEGVMTEAKKIEIRAHAGEKLTVEETRKLEKWEKMRPTMTSTIDELNADVRAYRGNYIGAAAHRAPTVVRKQTSSFLFFNLWRMGGLMLIGMGLMKLGVFSHQKDIGFYRRLLIWGCGLGLPLVTVSSWQLAVHDWDFLYFRKMGMHWNYVGSVFVSLGYVSLIMIAVKRKWLGSLERGLAAVGRMAFTNYLMQSIICTTIFYGHGFGLYGSLERPTQLFIVLAVWIFQIWYSSWWLTRFRYGPAEWFWRILTYGKRVGFRR